MSVLFPFTRPLITFGVELEFVIVIKKTALLEWNAQRGRTREETELHRNDYMREYVSTILSTHGVDPYNPSQLPPPPPTWQNMVLGTVILADPKRSDYRFWSVCKESSIGVMTSDLVRNFRWEHNDHVRAAQFDEEFWYDGAEIVSSILATQADFQWPYQLERIWRILHNASKEHKWMPNHVAILCRTPRVAGCGVHVHIGYGNDDIPWKVVQTIYILWGIYEHEIEELQPIERRASHNAYALSLRSNCRANFTYHKYAKGIMSAQNEHQLNLLLTPPRHQARDLKIGISFPRGDLNTPGYKRGTLEFREGYGTLENIPLTWWIKFIEAIVKLAQSLVDIKFDLVGDLYDNPVGQPGLVMKESIFDHIAISTLPQEGLDHFEGRKAEYSTLLSPSIAPDEDDPEE